tara:strand:+ start:16248 stop:17261 length:1014 start_codon:yes stop_codon:yes gene_type:complete
MKIRPPKPRPVPVSGTLFSTYAWHPGMADDKVLRVSKSSLGAFQTCEQQYFAKYVLGVKEPENDNMIRGTNVHDAYEFIMGHSLDIEHATSLKEERGYDAVKDYFHTLIPEKQIKKGWDDEYAKPTGNDYTLGEPAHLSKLMVGEAKRFMVSNPNAFKPVGNELGVDALVELDINGTKVQVHLNGFIDRLFLDDNGDYHVHELKTGLWKDKKTKYQSMAKEMAFYVYMLSKSTQPDFGGVKASYWGWDHTRGHEHNPSELYRFVEPVKSKVLLDMLTDLKALVSAHLRYKGDNDGKMFAVKPSGSERYFCEPWCAIKGYCPKYERHMMPHELRPKTG